MVRASVGASDGRGGIVSGPDSIARKEKTSDMWGPPISGRAAVGRNGLGRGASWAWAVFWPRPVISPMAFFYFFV
jgi:hypothetical protein